MGPGSTPFLQNAKVTIDGKSYPTNILYEISNKGLSEVSVNAQTGAVDLKTANGKITYMTVHEKSNLYKERSIPRSQFYNRLPLTRDNGERYDYVVVNLNTVINPWGANRIEPNDKVGFMINGQLYDEGDIKNISPETISSLNRFGSATYRPDMLYKNKYKILYNLTSSNDRAQNSNTQTNPNYRYDSTGVVFHGQFTGINESNAKGEKHVTDTPKFISTRNYRFFGASQDTIVFYPQAYKIALNAPLIDLVNKLPNVTTNDYSVFIGSKIINALLINNREYNGTVMQGIKSLPADVFAEIQIINTDPRSPNPALLNVIVKRK